MAAAILTLVLTTIVSGTAWLMLGNLLRLNADERQNDIANLATYAAVLLPIAAAALLHRFVEAPALRWGRGLARGGTAYGVTTMGVRS